MPVCPSEKERLPLLKRLREIEKLEELDQSILQENQKLEIAGKPEILDALAILGLKTSDEDVSGACADIVPASSPDVFLRVVAPSAGGAAESSKGGGPCARTLLASAKMSFCPDPKSVKGGPAFTSIYERKASDGVFCASVNAGAGRNLKVGGGTINGQFGKELWDAGWHQTDHYGAFHMALFKHATGTGSHPGLIEAPAALARTRPEGVSSSYIYLGQTDSEAESVGKDPGRGGLVILDAFDKSHRPYHPANVGMVYAVGPDRADEANDSVFLQKVRLVGRNILSACCAYNASRSELGDSDVADSPQFQRVRLCLVSGGKFAGRVPKEKVAEQLVVGLLDALPESLTSEALEAAPVIEFAYDGDVFKRIWDQLCGEATRP